MTSTSETKRLVPDEPFPPYTYVPGQGPHPVRDPDGHLHGVKAPRPACPEPGAWTSCREYMFGIDLFNEGYYWEAHEVWESLWHACGRRGTTAEFLKGLIKLAAAGVKARENNPTGVHRHATRAGELFGNVHSQLTTKTESNVPARLMGLSLDDLRTHAAVVVRQSPAETPVDTAARRVFPFRLTPNDDLVEA